MILRSAALILRNCLLQTLFCLGFELMKQSFVKWSSLIKQSHSTLTAKIGPWIPLNWLIYQEINRRLQVTRYPFFLPLYAIAWILNLILHQLWRCCAKSLKAIFATLHTPLKCQKQNWVRRGDGEWQLFAAKKWKPCIGSSRKWLLLLEKINSRLILIWIVCNMMFKGPYLVRTCFLSLVVLHILAKIPSRLSYAVGQHV